MKKIISYIMILCLSSILVFSNISKAATVSGSISTPTSIYLNKVDSYVTPIDSTDNPIGDYVSATYEGDFNVNVNTSVTDAYLSGYISGAISVTPNLPSGYAYYSTNISTNVFESNCYISSSSTTVYVTAYFDNAWNRSNYTLASVHVSFTYAFTYTGSNTPDPNSRILCSISSSTSSSNLNVYPEPLDNGLVHIISTAINNGDFSGKVNELVNLLTLVKDNNSTYYTNILAALNTENGWLEEIFTQLDNWDQIWWPAIYSENQTQSSRLQTVLNNLQTIISDLVLIDSNNVTWLTRLYNKVSDIYNYMQKSDQGATKAANAADNAAAQASQIAAVPRPNANAIINEGVSRIDTDISSGFSVLGAILNQQWYIWLLMIVISLAFVSYLMYGKGV